MQLKVVRGKFGCAYVECIEVVSDANVLSSSCLVTDCLLRLQDPPVRPLQLWVSEEAVLNQNSYWNVQLAPPSNHEERESVDGFLHFLASPKIISIIKKDNNTMLRIRACSFQT